LGPTSAARMFPLQAPRVIWTVMVAVVPTVKREVSSSASQLLEPHGSELAELPWPIVFPVNERQEAEASPGSWRGFVKSPVPAKSVTAPDGVAAGIGTSGA